MAVTKILAKSMRIDKLINYVCNPNKTDEQTFVSCVGCERETAADTWMATKRRYGKTNGVQAYHIIQAFQPNEVTPEIAHEIGNRFVKEHLDGYEVIVGTHVDKHHIHNHIIYNSVSDRDGSKYHSSRESYYREIRGLSDSLCKEYGLSVIENPSRHAMSRVEWEMKQAGILSDREIVQADIRDCLTLALDTGGISIIPVTAGTIFVNTPATGIPDERVRNNTILHECVHWMLHRPAFLLAKLWNHEYSAVACRRPGQAVNREWTAIDRMEWQANSLAPRILMPDWATRFIADGWLHRYERFSPIIKMEKTIDRLSRHFNVSRQLAKIRMTELGYEDAKEAFSYYDKRKHTISFENATRELARNKSFRDTLASGIYAFVDNCFVIRDRKYIYRDESNALHLTPYAKAHMAECCLAFSARRINRGMQYGMLRYNVEDETFVTGSGLPTGELAKRSQAVSNILQGLPSTFSETLVAHMKRKGITCEKLAEASMMSTSNVYRFRKEPYPVVSLKNVICLSIGLKLHPALALDLIRKAGYSLNGSKEHVAYQTLLFSMTNSSIYECNAFLSAMGIKPLGKEE